MISDVMILNGKDLKKVRERGEKNKGCEGGKVRVRKLEEKKVKRKMYTGEGTEMKECYRFTQE